MERPTTAPLSTVNASTAPRASTAPSPSSSSQNVRVVTRVRPLSQKEIDEQSQECISASSRVVRLLTDDKRFEFDSVFGPSATQEEVYRGTAGNMIQESIYKGFNGTILAYGQTGSGKTFTMGTDGGNTNNNNDTPSPSDGVIARAVHDLFRIRQSLPSGPDRVKIEMSYLEIYNEQAIDLLSDDPSTTVLQVRDSKTEGVMVQNLKSYEVCSPAEVSALMERASAKRATGSTQMNSVSSRSHAICTLNVTIAPLDGEEENLGSPREMMKAKLTLVDLAGSERIKKTGAEGARMKEGININKGLFVLGQVVSALSELGQQQGAKKSNAHIPYRDSKLTRLLQDSLGGNSRTVMIACISPAQSNAEETINTLRYAERTRNIKNSAVRNLVSGGLSSAEAAALRKENQQLKLELAQLRDGSISTGPMRSLPSLANTEVSTKLRAQCSSFLAENDLLKERIKSHSGEVLEASLRADKWQAKFERAVDVAEQHGVDLSDKIDIDGAESIVNQLRNQLSEAKTELMEARADAAMARATAGAVIAGKGDLDSISGGLDIEMPAFEEDESSDRDNITNELSAVSGTIEQKEAMLQQMLKERSCRETIQIHLQNSLRMLQTEVDDLTAEKSHLMEQMNQNMEDSSRRKCKTEVNPVTKRLREQIKSLENRINELKQKASEHQKSLRMKEEAEKKVVRLTNEIAQDKRRRTELQKKLKEASNEIRAEKKAAQQNAARMMRDSQKLKIELQKIKSAAEKQAVVLKRKIDEAAAKEKARLELENKRKHVERMRMASASGDGGEIKESRKQELEAWIEREIECSILKAQINDHQSQLESAMSERKRLMKSNSDTVDILQLESIEDDCKAIRAAIGDLEDTAKKAFPAFESSNPAWRFVDTNLFKTLSKPEAKHVMSYVFDLCSSVKHELDSVIADQEYKINLEIDAAVAKERQLHERDIMKLKMKHGEATLNLLESTQGAVSSNIKEMLASSENEEAKSQFESTLNTYMKHCMSTEKRFKSDLEEMTFAAEGMERMMDDVTQGISFVPATARKPKRFASYESEEEMDILEESFEEEGDESDADYVPTPKPEKKKKTKTAKRQQAVDSSPLLGESILDEDSLSNLTVSKLKEECKKRNLSSTGRKCELQERLKADLSLSKQVIFEEDLNDIAADNDASFDEKPVAEPKQLFDENEELSETMSTGTAKSKSSTEYFASLLSAPSAKKSSNARQPSISRPSTAPQTPSKMLGKSPKRKRDSDDAVKTPASAKKFRPLGFLSSSPRKSSPPTAAVPLGNHNRTPVMFKHTASSRKRMIAKRPPTASEQKRTKRGMNDAVNRALEICNIMNSEGTGQN